MAKPKRKQKNKGSGYKPPPVDRQRVLGDLQAKVAEIEQAEGGALGPLFGEVHKLLLKTDADRIHAMQLIGMRDVGGLKKLIRQMKSTANSEPSVPENGSVSSPGQGDHEHTEDAAAQQENVASAQAIDAETMRKAMRAFRKRLKLVRLDHESKLGVGPLTGGRKHGVDAIMAPREYPAEVWEALVEAGNLRHVGKEFYQLADE